MVDTLHPRATGRESPLTDWLNWLSALLVHELALRPGRFSSSLRQATIATVGVGLMASCHVLNPLGPYVVWIIMGSNPMLSMRKAVIYAIIIAAVIAAAYPLAGILVESPWLLVSFIGAFVALSTYEIIPHKLGSAGLVVQVITLDTFYGAVFTPRDFGWSAASLAGGCAIAFVTVAAFDTWIWPDPAEPRLLASLAASLERMRARFVKASAYYLGEAQAVQPSEPPATSEMPAQLALLATAIAEGLSESRRKLLLALISTIERLHIRVDRIQIVAREEVAHGVRVMVRPEMTAACAEIAAALSEFARDVAVMIRTGEDRPPALNADRARAAADRLNAQIIEVRPRYIRTAAGSEVANFAAFGENLQAMLLLLERPIDVAPAAEQTPAPGAAPADRSDPALPRYCLKLALCVVVGYIVGLITQRADLSTILTTVLTTGLPTYGAALRKMILRLIGAIIGGAISLLAIIAVSPNFDTLPSYMFVTFAALFISAYSGLGSGRVAYAGKQIGTTYILVVVGLSPAVDIYSPLWRTWGILLGIIVVAVIFFITWPEYAGDSLLPRLRRVISDTLALVPGGSATAAVRTIDATSAEITGLLGEMLEVAEDARLEGRKGLIDHDAVVQSAGTIRRIAHRIASFTKLSIIEPLPRLDDATEAAREAFDAEIRSQLEEWLAFYQRAEGMTSAAALALAAQHSRSEIARPMEEFAGRIEADGFARIAAWAMNQRSHILANIQSMRRLEFLMYELNVYLSHVLGGGPAMVFSDAEGGATPPPGATARVA
jgi:uncharacterized membrane protein YccC